MPWPTKIIRLFDLARSEGITKESAYYGPYNTLLHHLFPFEEGYMVIPQCQRLDEIGSAKVTFVVEREQHPVFFLQVNPSGHILSDSRRELADDRMRDRFRCIGRDCVVDEFYGVSAMGTSLCFYAFDKGTRFVLPRAIAPDRDYVNDTAPVERWSVDTLTPEGEQRLRGAVTHVKTMCALVLK